MYTLLRFICTKVNFKKKKKPGMNKATSGFITASYWIKHCIRWIVLTAIRKYPAKNVSAHDHQIISCISFPLALCFLQINRVYGMQNKSEYLPINEFPLKVSNHTWSNHWVHVLWKQECRMSDIHGHWEIEVIYPIRKLPEKKNKESAHNRP